MPMQPMPMQSMPMQPYGSPYQYPNQWQMMRPPMYPPYPMPMPRPAYYNPPPVYSYQPATPPRMLNYGPLQKDGSVAVATDTPAGSTPANNGVIKTNVTKTDHVESTPQASCAGGDCSAGTCGAGGSCDACDAGPLKLGPLPPPQSHGHFFGDLGVEFLVLYPDMRAAYSTSSPTSSSTVNFAHEVDYAPYFQLGYVFQNGCGIRGDFWFLHGNSNLTYTNSSLTTSVSTPAFPEIVSPSATLQAGIGTDQFTFTRSFDFKVGDVEFIKECNCFDMQFLFAVGARYAIMSQGYSASRTNGGGVSALTGTAVSQDTENLSLQSTFEGIGPTLSLECVNPIRTTCFAFYGSVRGSCLLGIERYYENHTLQSATTPLGGATTFVNNAFNNEISNNRAVPVVEAEFGIQFGKRVGRCYVFSRFGAVAGRWWDVGSSLSNNSNLDVLGGAFKLGVIY
jgi:hypothetical protein